MDTNVDTPVSSGDVDRSGEADYRARASGNECSNQDTRIAFCLLRHKIPDPRNRESARVSWPL